MSSMEIGDADTFSYLPGCRRHTFVRFFFSFFFYIDIYRGKQLVRHALTLLWVGIFICPFVVYVARGEWPATAAAVLVPFEDPGRRAHWAEWTA